MHKKIKLLLIASFAMMAFTAKSQSSTPLPLTALQAQLSTQFKQLVGQDRLSVFQQLQGLIKSKSSANYDSTIVSITDESQVIALLGNPDERAAPTVLVYHLTNVGKKYVAVVGIDDASQVLYCSLTDVD